MWCRKRSLEMKWRNNRWIKANFFSRVLGDINILSMDTFFQLLTCKCYTSQTTGCQSFSENYQALHLNRTLCYHYLPYRSRVALKNLASWGCGWPARTWRSRWRRWQWTHNVGRDRAANGTKLMLGPQYLKSQRDFLLSYPLRLNQIHSCVYQ